jgi:hypothetical protein
MRLTFPLWPILFILIILKLCGVLTCSWFWVISPLWIIGGIFALVATIMGVLCLTLLICRLYDENNN